MEIPKNLDLNFEVSAHELLCLVQGDLEETAISLLEASLEQWMAEHCGTCIVDLRKANHLCGAALLMLPQLHQAAQARGNQIIFILHPRQRKALHDAGIESLLTIVETVEEARLWKDETSSMSLEPASGPEGKKEPAISGPAR